jgi:hypothetical protein
LLVSTEAMLRTRPAAAFALLNHILINGFFFSQGFAICLFPSNTVLDFVQSRKLSHHSVHAEARTSVALSCRAKYRQDLSDGRTGI